MCLNEKPWQYFLVTHIFILDPLRHPSDVFVSFITLPLFSCVFFPLRVEITFHFKAESECNLSWSSLSCQSKQVDAVVAMGVTWSRNGAVKGSGQLCSLLWFITLRSAILVPTKYCMWFWLPQLSDNATIATKSTLKLYYTQEIESSYFCLVGNWLLPILITHSRYIIGKGTHKRKESLLYYDELRKNFLFLSF